MELTFAKQQLNHTLDIVRRRDVEIQRLLFVNQLHHQRQAEAARQLASTMGVLTSPSPIATAKPPAEPKVAQSSHATAPSEQASAIPTTPTREHSNKEDRAMMPNANENDPSSVNTNNDLEVEPKPNMNEIQPLDNQGKDEANDSALVANLESNLSASDAAFLAAAQTAACPNSPSALAAADAIERAQSFVQLYENGRVVKVAPELAAKLQRQQRLNQELEHAAPLENSNTGTVGAAPRTEVEAATTASAGPTTDEGLSQEPVGDIQPNENSTEQSEAR